MTSYVERAACIVILVVVAAHAARGQDSRSALRADLAKLYAEQRYEEMLRTVEPALQQARDAADLWIMAAEAAFKIEDWGRAASLFERGVALDPKLGALSINLGFAYLKLDRTADAGRLFESFSADPNRSRAAKALYGLGLVHAARGDQAAARKAFESAIGLDADDARPHYRLGQLALEAGDHPQAILSFTAALARDELHYGAAHGLARAHAVAGNAADAARWKDRHAKILEVADATANMIPRLGAAADPVAARIAIGLKLEEAGAVTKAAAWYQRALKLDPANEEARRRLKEARVAGAESRR